MNKVARYWHTLRHLRPVQFYGRVWFQLARPRPDLSPAPPLRARGSAWRTPVRREASLTAPRQFLFLNEPGHLAEVGWDGPQREKLWRYNQHYFDDLNARDADLRNGWHLDLLHDWLRCNPPAAGNGWEPYPVSLRIVNWIKWALAGHELPTECVQSLAVQARWLTRRLEIHLQGNHLFANAKALVFAGLFFGGAEAQRWLHTGMRILRQQVPEQVLADGAHFELSTMYHAIALEDMLDLCNVTRCYGTALGAADRQLSDTWLETAARMREWLLSMCHPDGEIAFFNDAAYGIAPSRVELEAYAARLGLSGRAGGSCWLRASGMARLEYGPAVALLDLARVGPDYLPGHAHADTLAMELSVHGMRVLVNSGTSCYGAGPERVRQRGTAAHNTVTVNGIDSSEVWGGFRVARRANVVDAAVVIAPDTLQARGSHDGYARLPGQPLHSREWTLDATGLAIHDTLSVPGLSAEARFHFHPGVTLEAEADGSSGVATLPGGRRIGWRVERGRPHLQSTTWHPGFGVSVPNSCLCVRLQHGASAVRLTWH